MMSNSIAPINVSIVILERQVLKKYMLSSNL